MTTAATPLAVYPFRGCVVRLWSPDFLETVFPDGHACPATLHDSPENSANAAAWGYRGPHAVRRMHLDHELLHTHLSELVGLPWSPVLRRVAGWPGVIQELRDLDEARTIAFQRYLTGGMLPHGAGLDRWPTPLLEAVARDFRVQFNYVAVLGWGPS